MLARSRLVDDLLVHGLLALLGLDLVEIVGLPNSRRL